MNCHELATALANHRQCPLKLPLQIRGPGLLCAGLIQARAHRAIPQALLQPGPRGCLLTATHALGELLRETQQTSLKPLHPARQCQECPQMLGRLDDLRLAPTMGIAQACRPETEALGVADAQRRVLIVLTRVFLPDQEVRRRLPAANGQRTHLRRGQEQLGSHRLTRLDPACLLHPTLINERGHPLGVCEANAALGINVRHEPRESRGVQRKIGNKL